MTGYVIVGGVAYLNSWLPAGKAIRQVICLLCEDTGYQLDDDGFTTVRCDCRTGEAQPSPRRAACGAYCGEHQRACSDYADSHRYDRRGNQLHICVAGGVGGRGHDFYAEVTA